MNRLFVLVLFSLLLATGCMSYRSTSIYNGVNVDGGRRPVETIEIANSGWFLFTCLPIASGNPDRPNSNSSLWFRNTVSLDSNVKVLRRRMAEKGVTEVANLTSHCEDEKYLVFLLARRAYRTSAVLLEPLPAEKAAQEKTLKSKESSK